VSLIPTPNDDENALIAFKNNLITNPAAVYLSSLTSQLSRYTMRNALRTIIAVVRNVEVGSISDQVMLSYNWGALRYQHTAAIRSILAERYSPSNANRILSALRGVLREAWRLEYMTAEEYQRAIDIKLVKSHILPHGRDLDNEEIKDLAEACRADPSIAGIRDLAIIGLLYSCGLRRSELVNLEWTDFNERSGQLKIRMGKGRKQRTVYVTGGTLKALMRWATVLGASSGAMFRPILKNGRIMNTGMVSQSIYDMLKRRSKEAGVSDFSPHDLRRTFVGDMLDSGVDIATVADIAGHSSIETTRRYDRRPETTKKTAAEKINFPADE
jgi:integrase